MNVQRGNKGQVRQTANIEWDEIPKNPGQLPFVVLAEGLQGVGKTHFSMTFPEPIFILDTENRADVVAAKFAGNKKVYRKKITTFNDLRLTLVQRIFSEHEGGTIVIDSGSDLQTMAELEYLEEAKMEKIYPTYIWARVWEKIDNMLKTIRDRGFYCVITGRLRDEYTDDGKRTGDYVLEGYKKLPYRVDLHLRLLPDFTAEVYKNGFRNEPIDRVKVLERPSYSEIMDKLIMGNVPKVDDLEEVKPSKVKPAKTKNIDNKTLAKEVEKAVNASESELEAPGETILNQEGNHIQDEENPPQIASYETDSDLVATKEQVVEAYKYGLGLGLDNSTLKMLLFDIRGEDVADQDKISDGMTVSEIEIWKEGMRTIAEEYLGAKN